jgi:hypothetical protein
MFKKNIKFYSNKTLFKINKPFSTKRQVNNTIKKDKEEKIFLFSHDTAKKYYQMNVLPLIGYLGLSSASLLNSDYPDYLRRTMTMFMSASFLALLGISIYAKRHIYSIHLMKPSNILIIETFSKLGFGKFKTYQMPLKDVTEMIPVSKYIKTKNTGIYILKPNQSTKYFNFLNFFFIRPKSGLEFDQIFKSKLRK